MDEIIKKARMLNIHFDDLTTEQQFRFIQRYINKDIILQELIWYYDSMFGCPYDELTLRNKVNANRRRLEKA